MNKSTVVFIMLFLFSTGISVGMSLSIYDNIINEKEQKIISKRDSIQDIVIKEIQEEQDQKYEVQEVASTSQEKISPYAKITVEKYYKQCDHSTIEIYDVPKELVNLTQEELQKRYENWEIKQFSSNDIQLYRQINANCSSHFVLKEKDGYIAVYKVVSNNLDELNMITEIEYASLKEEDKLAVENGIKIYGKEELSSVIEDFSS
ncbi:MAG: BofC C-terminal domain-containing protein [Clostridia bacterium]|nr:BofC C-terminal domain-containing protein [Clostridia bacterium]